MVCYNKLHDPDFIFHRKKGHILELLESKPTADDIDKLQFLDYECFQACQKKKLFGQKHGGLQYLYINQYYSGSPKFPPRGLISSF